MKAKNTLLMTNKITENPVLARRALFWHVAPIIMEQRNLKLIL